jgi:hypothetical protein
MVGTTHFASAAIKNETKVYNYVYVSMYACITILYLHICEGKRTCVWWSVYVCVWWGH